MLALLTMVLNMAMAQEVTLDFNENTWNLPNNSQEKTVDAKTFTNGNYTITLQGSSDGGYYYNGTGMYVLLGKMGATLTLPAFDFDVEKIVITGTSGASAAVEQNIFVGDTEVSTKTTGAKNVANEYDIAEAYQKAGNIYQLKVISNHNTQFTKIEIYKKGTSGPTKTIPEMAFEPNAVTVTIGENLTTPTLTYNGDGAVTYTSSHEDVATVDANSGAINIVAVGSTTITATAAETDNYKAASAKYTLTVKQAAIDDGDDNSIIFANLSLDNGVQYSEPFDGGNFTVTFSGGSNDGKYYNTGQGIRVYGDGKMTIAAKSGNLTQIEVTFDGTNKPESDDVVDTGSFNADTGIWTGKASEVTFTRPSGTGHWRVQAISVSIEGGSGVEKKAPEMAFSPTALTAYIGESFTEPTLTYNGDGAISYTISNQEVATINATTGKLTLVGKGTATVTATAAETDNYRKGTASYALTVNEKTQDEPNAIIFANLGLENGVQYSDPFDADAFTVTFAGGQNDGKYYNTGQGVRVYGDGSFTVDSKAGNMIQIVITFDAAYKPETADVASTGTYNPETGVWDGKASSVTFTRPTGSGHWRVQKIAVTFEGGEVHKTLTISGTTPFKNTTTVTITPSNEDYAIYYTLDGTEPGASATSQVYTTPFQLTATTTVKAVEEDYAGELSTVVEKTFMKEETPDLTTVANIAEFKALADGTEATLTLADAYVLWVNGSDAYVRDASGAIDFYGTGITFTAGKKLNGTITGKRATYNKIPELAKTDGTNADGFTATDGAAKARTITLAQANSDTYFCDLVRIEGVKITSKVEGKYTNVYAYIGTDSVMVYDRFGIGMGNYNETDTYNVEGILVPFSGKYEIYITQPLAEGSQQTNVCNSIAEFKALSNGTEAELKLTNAQVVHVSGNDVYVRDASGAIEFYNTGITFQPNQILNGSITGKYSPYNNLPELAKTNNTNADKLTITDGQAAVPTNVGVAQLATDQYLCDLVLLENANVVEEEGKLYATAGDSRVLIYDKFKTVGDDLVAGVTVSITGISSIFKNDYQLLPISYTLSAGIHQLTNDRFDPAMPVYNTAGQKVDAAYKGIVIQNGRKFILK